MSPHAQIHREGEFPLRKIHCVLVHDHLLFRQGLRCLLENEPDFEVVSEAGNAAEALQRVFEHRPDAVIVNDRSLGLSESEAETAILRECPQARVFFLTAEGREESGLRDSRAHGAEEGMSRHGWVILFAVGRSPHGPRLVGVVSHQLCHNLCD